MNSKVPCTGDTQSRDDYDKVKDIKLIRIICSILHALLSQPKRCRASSRMCT